MSLQRFHRVAGQRSFRWSARDPLVHRGLHRILRGHRERRGPQILLR